MDSFSIDNEQRRQECLRHIHDMPIDKVPLVTISDKASRSARQNALYWLWCTEVAASGKGGRHEESKDSVHRLMKYLFARPIFLRDDPEMFGVIYANFMADYGTDKKKVLQFVDDWISTTRMNTSQFAEYLAEIYAYYSNPEKEIWLSVPEHKGLLNTVD